MLGLLELPQGLELMVTLVEHFEDLGEGADADLLLAGKVEDGFQLGEEVGFAGSSLHGQGSIWITTIASRSFIEMPNEYKQKVSQMVSSPN